MNQDESAFTYEKLFPRLSEAKLKEVILIGLKRGILQILQRTNTGTGIMSLESLFSSLENWPHRTTSS
jgi:hypothetical protein